MASLSDDLVQELLKGRYVASLATHNSDGTIHVVAVWYLFEAGQILVATSTRTRKARNLLANAKVSLMIDSRGSAAALGATISGVGQLLKGKASQEANARIHQKYLSEAALADPRVGPVFASWDDVTIQIEPVSVIAWDMGVADRHVFGGAFAANPEYMLPVRH